jgi:hypothetical protein
MPSIISDFSPFGRVGFNLRYCYEIPLWVFEAVGGKNEPEARKNGVDGT